MLSSVVLLFTFNNCVDKVHTLPCVQQILDRKQNLICHILSCFHYVLASKSAKVNVT